MFHPGNGNLINPGFLRNPKSRVLKFLINKKKMFYIQKNNLKNTKILFIFFLFFTPKNNWKDKKFSFWPKLFRNNQFNEFHHILFQSDKNDEINNLRMNKINCKQVNLFNLIVLNESLFLLNWVFQLMNFIFFIWLILFNLRNSIKSSKR